LPDREHIALVLRPSTVEPTRAVFFFRGEQDQVVKGLECELEEWHREPIVAPPKEEMADEVAEIEPATSTEPEPKAADPIPVVAAEPVAQPSGFAIHSVEVPQPAPPPVSPPVRNAASPAFDMFAFAGKPPRQKKLPLWAGAVAVLLVIALAGWFTQDSWIPRAPLNLSSTETDGNLAIRWNAAAFRGIDHASLFVNDDGELHTLPLDRFTLNQGIFHYTHGPKSQRVTAKLAAGEESAIAVWLAPAPPAPPAPAAAAPAPDTAPK
jgi:hypothetical protein